MTLSICRFSKLPYLLLDVQESIIFKCNICVLHFGNNKAYLKACVLLENRREPFFS